MAQVERLGRVRARSLALNGVKVTPTAAQINLLTQGVAAGYKVARGVSSITGSGVVASGLATVVAVVASLQDDPALTGTLASGSFSGANLTLKVWKPTSAADGTPIAATAAKNVAWVAIGT